jgi:hypothetical protein
MLQLLDKQTDRRNCKLVIAKPVWEGEIEKALLDKGN